MSTTLTSPEVEAPRETTGGGGGFSDIEPGGGGDRGGGSVRRSGSYETMVWVLMIPVTMLFMGLTSAMIVRKGISNDWISIQVPQVLYFNTILLLASSVTLEVARRALKIAETGALKIWLAITSLTGVIFLAGQVLAWKRLAAQGVFLASNPASSFFYVLTATHGAHLLGGITALIYLTIRIFRVELNSRRESAFRATTVYWHFMDALWIYLLLLLIFWR
jgi:cytochrome c oxidase subunit 3